MYNFEKILPLVEDSLNKLCCRKRVGDGYSLIVDFGEKIYHNKPRRTDLFQGEWSFGIYSRAWRVRKDNKIILGGYSKFDNHVEADNALQKIHFGKLKSILFTNDSDMVLILDNSISIEFLACSHNEENFHIFLPEKRSLVYYSDKNWVYGKSDLPWPNYLNFNYK